MCRLLGVSKQAFYKHENHLMRRLALEAFVVEFVKEIRSKDPGIGGNKLWQMYRNGSVQRTMWVTTAFMTFLNSTG